MSEPSLRMTLFQRYTHLQMWLLTRILWYTAIIYLITLVLFALLRLFTGISIKRVGYFNLRHIILTPRQGVEVRIGKLGISPHRPTVARPGFLTFVVSNLEVIVNPKTLLDSKANHDSSKSSDAENDGGDRNTSDNNTTNDGTDNSSNDSSGSQSSYADYLKSSDGEDFNFKGVPLLPKRKAKAFKWVRWLITTMRVFDIQLQSVSIAFTDITTVIFTSINLRLDLRKTKNYNVSNFVGTLDTYKLSDGELPINARLSITDAYTADSLEDETPWQVFEDLRFDVTGVLSLEAMLAKELGLQIHLGRFQLDASNALELIAKFKKLKLANAVNKLSTETSTPEPDTLSDYESEHPKKRHSKKFVKVAMLMLHLVHKVQLTAGIMEVLKVPVDTAYFATSMKDVNFDLSRMNPLSSGFKLLYAKGDTAHQAIFSVASITGNIDNGMEQEEILYVPLVTSLVRGNLFSQTLRFLQEDKKKNDSKLKAHLMFHAPNLSVEEHQIYTLVRVALGFDSPEKANKSASTHLTSPGSSDSDSESSSPRVPFQRILPNVDLDVTVIDPAFRLVCDTTENCRDAMFVMSSQRLHLALTSTHDSGTDSYSGLAMFETRGDHAYYHSSSAHRVDIASSQTTHLTVTATTKPYFHLDIEGKQSDLRIEALRHEIFCAIGQLHAAVIKPISAWAAKHSHRRAKPKPPSDPALKGTVLRKLPSWLNKVSFKANDSSMAIATNKFRGQTNEILGIKLQTQEFAVVYESSVSEEELGDPKKFAIETTSDGRRLRVSGKEIVLLKADSSLLYQGEDSITMQHSVAQLPKFGLQVRSHNTRSETIEINIEPRLRIDLNINLILAFSVVREILYVALLRNKVHNSDGNATEKSDEKSQVSKLNNEKVKEISTNSSENDNSEDASKPANKPSSIGVLHNIILTMPRALIKIDMPSDDQIMFDLGSTKAYKLGANDPVLHTKSVHLFSQHPFQRTSWCIIASLVKVHAEVDMKAKPRVEDKIKLNLDGLRINVPYKFKLYRIIDNGITLAKAIKTLIVQTHTRDTMTVLNPKEIKGVPNIPRVRIKAQQLLVSLEDEYFESDLTLVMLTQRNIGDIRRRKMYLLDARIKSMIRKALKILDIGDIENHISDSRNSPQATSSQERPGTADSEEKVHDRLGHVANTFKRTATVFTEHSHYHKSRHGPSNSETGNDFDTRLALSLRDAPREKIHRLLNSGIELGCPADDGDESFTKDHPWLDFWSSPDFREFRKQPVLLNNGSPGKLTIDEARSTMLQDFSRMWIDTIRHERKVQHLGARKAQTQVCNDELSPDTCAEENIIGFSQKPLLMSVDIRQLDLTIDKTTHDTVDTLHKFLFDIGKGQPMDSAFSILVPLYVDLRAHGGMRVDIRDYPLPVIHFPGLGRSQDPKTNLALQIKGDLVITEQLMDAGDRNIRKLYVPLKPLPKEKRKIRGSDVIEVHRTLTPIKTFTDLKFHVGSNIPTRVSWCMAYKPGFHGVGESFSGFSKPPIDPSPALGFWDKIRLVLHARFDFQLPKSALWFCLKAGKSPYDLLNDSSGFVFSWRDNVRLEINADDNPRSLFLINSDVFELLVPNYLEWESEFLHATPAERSMIKSSIQEKIASPDKTVFSLAQRTTWKMGMMFQRSSARNARFAAKTGIHAENRDSDFRPHYDVSLCMPEYIDDIKNYDAYHGFRSDFIHMAISVVSRPVGGPDLGTGEANYMFTNLSNLGANKCTAHLTLGVLHHFKQWKSQFSSEQWPPIKTGSLFPDPVRVRPSNKTFGTALSTAEYQIALSPLDLSFFHQMRHHAAAESHDRCTGLKAKVDDFVFDWHTRREPPVVRDEDGKETVELDGHRRWRMKSHLGEVRLSSVQVCVVDAKLRTQSSKDALKALHAEDNSDSEDDNDTETVSSDGQSASFSGSGGYSAANAGRYSTNHFGPKYVGDDYWIDLDDYTEVGKWRNLRSKTPEVKVLPFMHTPQFNYLRSDDFSGRAVYVDPKTNHRIPKFGDIVVHDCLMSSNQPERVQADLLDTRRDHLKEHIEDFKSSLESLESQHNMNAEMKSRMNDLKGLIAIGEFSSDLLREEMMNFYAVADHADANEKEIQRMKEKDFQIQMYVGSEAYDSDDEEKVKKAYEDPEWAAAFTNSHPSLDSDFSRFTNRYIIHAMHLKWNNSVRNLVYRLQTSLSEDKELNYVRCRPAVQYLEELVSKAEAMAKQDESQEEIPQQQNSDSQKSGDAFDILQHPTHIKSKLKRQNTSRKASKEEEYDAKEEENRNRAERIVSHTWENESRARLNHLFEDLKTVKDDEIVQKAHSVSFLSPRIQFIAEENPSKCLQMTARNVEVQVVDTFSKSSTVDSESAQIERRYGVVLNKSGFFVIGEEDIEQPGIQSLCLEKYSGEEERNDVLWPPWIAIEMCYNTKPLQQFLVVEDISFGIRYDEPNDLHVSSEHEIEETEDLDLPVEESNAELAAQVIAAAERKAQKAKAKVASGNAKSSNDDADSGVPGISSRLSKTLKHHGQHKGKAIVSSLVIDAPRLIINVDAVQFYAIYTIATDLLTYRDPLIKKREQSIDRMFLSNDFQGDYRGTLEHIELLQKDIRGIIQLRQLLLILNKNQTESSRDAQIHLIKLEREGIRRMTQLTVIMRAFKAILRKNMNTGVEKLSKWSLLTNSILMRMLSETGKPIVELYVRRVHYSRLSNSDNGSLNRATLAGIYARNMLENSTYPMMLANYETKEFNGSENSVKLKWTRLDRVGGIPILDNAEVKLKPLHIQLEHGLFEKILDFAFPINNRNKGDKENNQNDFGISDSDDGNAFTDDYDSDVENASIDGKPKKKSNSSKMLGKFRHGSKELKLQEDGIEEMMNRASNYWSIRSLKIHPTQLTISYKGNSRLSLMNLQNLEVPFPLFELHNKTWTKLELVMSIRKLAIKVLLAQSGSIISNKFKRHKAHTAKDDRDLSLEKLDTNSSRQSSDLKNTLRSELDALCRESSRRGSAVFAPLPGAIADSREIEKYERRLLVPEHRRIALVDPEHARDKMREQMNIEQKRIDNSANGSKHGESATSKSSITSTPTVSISTNHRSSFQSQRTFDQRKTSSSQMRISSRDPPGSPNRLRQPSSTSQQEQLTGPDFHKKRHSRPSFIDKIKKGFN